ncbi:MAG: ArsR family transcriptional regulator [Coriobacteriaceae bacterium]|nr:ArsR family transcriptional regulator [Coriobacteriaceae bacterium]
MDDERVFGALADPTRRRILDLLFERDGRTLGDLAQAIAAGGGPGRFGAMKHLRVLEAASLVSAVRAGREKHHYLNPVPIRRIHDRWLDKFTAGRAAALLTLATNLEARPMSNPVTPPSHVVAIYIRATPEAIWQALTDPAFTVQYYYGTAVESDWQEGSPYRYVGGDEVSIEGTVIEAAAPRRLVTTFTACWDEAAAAEGPSTVTFEIEDSDAPGVCRLTVTHSELADKPATFGQVAGGWEFIASGLKTLLETGTGFGG